jgi:hypothetical protein
MIDSDAATTGIANTMRFNQRVNLSPEPPGSPTREAPECAIAVFSRAPSSPIMTAASSSVELIARYGHSAARWIRARRVIRTIRTGALR